MTTPSRFCLDPLPVHQSVVSAMTDTAIVAVIVQAIRDYHLDLDREANTDRAARDCIEIARIIATAVNAKESPSP